MPFWSISRGQKINANFFCTKFFENPSGHGRPRRKSWTSAPKSAFSCGPGGGEKLVDPGASGRKGQECPREIRTKKFMFMLFFSPEFQLLSNATTWNPSGWTAIDRGFSYDETLMLSSEKKAPESSSCSSFSCLGGHEGVPVPTDENKNGELQGHTFGGAG